MTTTAPSVMGLFKLEVNSVMNYYVSTVSIVFMIRYLSFIKVSLKPIAVVVQSKSRLNGVAIII